jgi:hypothetical protein
MASAVRASSASTVVSARATSCSFRDVFPAGDPPVHGMGDTGTGGSRISASASSRR